MRLRSIVGTAAARSIVVVLALASVPACSDTSDHDLLALDSFELRADEPRDVRWQLCKEGGGTEELVNAQLELEISPSGTVEVRAWPSPAAYEANEEPEPLSGSDIPVDDIDTQRLELWPEAAFDVDGRRCTGDEFLRIELVTGTAVTIDATIEAHVIDYNHVIDRLILEAELLP
jgi:hypothetical protein